jgi:hypothetical protein
LSEKEQEKKETFFKRLLAHAAEPGVRAHEPQRPDRLADPDSCSESISQRNELGLQGLELVGLGVHGSKASLITRLPEIHRPLLLAPGNRYRRSHRW